MDIKGMKKGRDAFEEAKRNIKELLDSREEGIFVVGLGYKSNKKFAYINIDDPLLVLLAALEVIDAVCEAAMAHFREMSKGFAEK